MELILFTFQLHIENLINEILKLPSKRKTKNSDKKTKESEGASKKLYQYPKEVATDATESSICLVPPMATAIKCVIHGSNFNDTVQLCGALQRHMESSAQILNLIPSSGENLRKT